MKKEKKIFKNDQKLNIFSLYILTIFNSYSSPFIYFRIMSFTVIVPLFIFFSFWSFLNMFNFWAEIMLEEKCVLKLCTVHNAVFASIYDDTDVYILKSKMKLKKEWFDKYDFAVPDVKDIVYKKLLKITEI